MPELTPKEARLPGSVSELIPGLRAGDREAAGQLWRRYFCSLARLAQSRLNPNRTRAADGEDIAQDVLLEFCRLVAGPDADGPFPRLGTRDNVWAVLARMTAWAAFDHNTKEDRWAEVVAGESAAGEPGIAAAVGPEPNPEFHGGVRELLNRLDDPAHPGQGESLRAVARMRMEGYGDAEIAARLGCSARTIERKVNLIRKIWGAWLAGT